MLPWFAVEYSCGISLQRSPYCCSCFLRVRRTLLQQELFAGTKKAWEPPLMLLGPRAIGSSFPCPLTRTGAALSHFTANVSPFSSGHSPVMGNHNAPCSALAIFPEKKQASSWPGMCDTGYPKCRYIKMQLSNMCITPLPTSEFVFFGRMRPLHCGSSSGPSSMKRSHPLA